MRILCNDQDLDVDNEPHILLLWHAQERIQNLSCVHATATNVGNPYVAKMVISTLLKNSWIHAADLSVLFALPSRDVDYFQHFCSAWMIIIPVIALLDS